jgi:hypothetical protein
MIKNKKNIITKAFGKITVFLTWLGYRPLILASLLLKPVKKLKINKIKATVLKNKNIKIKPLKIKFKIRPIPVIAFGLLLILSPLAYLLIKNPTTVEAGWWDEMWKYRKSVPISSSNSTTQEDYQVLIDSLDTSSLITAGKMQSDCADIRFITADGFNLDYSIVGNTCNTTDTEIWVQVDTIPNGGKTIYMYYGNMHADAASSEENTFSYDSEKNVGYVLDMTVSDLLVISLADDNSISHNSSTLSLNKYETGQFSSISKYSPVSAKKLFNADDYGQETDALVPISWAGTEFVYYDRYANAEYDVIAPWQNASVDIIHSGGSCLNNTVTSIGTGITCPVSVGQVRISSDYPILIFSQTASSDPMALAPSSTGKWVGAGQTTYVLSNNSGADFRYSDSSLSVGETDPADLGSDTFTTIGGGSYGGPPGFIVWSVDNPIGVQQIGDGDGVDAHYYQLLREMGSVYGAYNIADYISIVSDQYFTCDAYDTSNGAIGIGYTATSSNNSVWYLGLGTGNSNTFSTVGWYLECDKQVGVHYQNTTGNDERPAWTYPMMRQFTYPTPTVGSLGSEEKGTAPISYWSFDEGYGTTVHNQMEKNGEDGLIAWWKMDLGTGSTAPDEMDINPGNFGTGNSAPAWTTGYIGNGLVFDGIDDYLDVLHHESLNLNTLTISLWMKTNYSGDTQGILSKYDNHGEWNYQLYSDASGYINFNVGADNAWETTLTSNTIINDNNWHHVTVTYDQINMKIFIDGVEDNSVSETRSLGTGARPLYIGANTYDASVTLAFDEAHNTFSGSLDNIKIYNRALSDGEVAGEYNSMHGHMLNMDPSSDWVAGAWPNANQKPLGKALDFDGTLDYLAIQDHSNLDMTDNKDLSISAWVKRNSTGTADIIASKRNSTADVDEGYAFWIMSGNPLRFEISDGTDVYDMQGTTQIVDNDKWYHVVVTFDEDNTSNCTFYIDGKEDSSISKTGTLGNVGDASNSLEFIIGNLTNKNQPFDGSIDEVKVFDYVLSADQVKKEYNRGYAVALNVGKSENDPNISSPIGWWKLDEGSGYTLFDSSGNENHGSLATGNSAPSWTQGYLGKGLDFDGTNDYADIPDSDLWDTGDELTVSHWFKTNTEQTSRGMVVHDASNYKYLTYINSDSTVLAFYIRNGEGGISYYASTTGYFADDQWHHLVGVFDRNESNARIKLYLDGILAGTAVGYDAAIIDGDEGIQIGRWGNGTEFAGQLDEVKIYDEALTPGQIAWEYSQGAPQAHWSFDEGYGTTIHNQQEKNGEDNLAGWWKLDEGSGTTALDEMGNYNGTLGTGNSAPSWITSGKIGNGLQFDGSNDYVSMGNVLNQTSSFTVAAWIYPHDITTSGQRIVVKDSSSDGWALSLGDGGSNTVRFFIRDLSEIILDSTNIIQTNAWQHIVGVYDATAGTKKLYINGSLNAGSTGLTGAPVSNTANFGIGGNPDTTANFFDGNIDNVKIYEKALTAAEVMNEYKTKQGHMINMDPSSDWVAGAWPNPNQKPLGKALDFDGTNDYLEIARGHNLLSTDISASMWIYPTSWTHQTHTALIASRSTLSDGLMFFILNQGNLNFDWGDGSSNYRWDTGFQPPLNKWTHLVITRDSSNRYLYVNGNLQSSTASPGGPPTADTLLTIGADSMSNQYNFEGKMDEVKIFGYALNTDEVKKEYNRGYSVVLGAGKNDSDPNINSPVGWWKFDEASGNSAFDSSGNNHNGTLGAGSSAPSWVQGKIGKALYFAPPDDYVSIPDNDAFSFGNATTDNPFSITCWIYMSNLETSRFVSKGNLTDNSLEYLFTTDAAGVEMLMFYLYDSNTSNNIYAASDSFALTTNQWTHIAATYDGSGNANNIHLYIDGIKADVTHTETGTYVAMHNTAYDFTIGRLQPNQSATGIIDNVKIYDHELTPAQIAWEYNQGGPIGYWRFDEGVGSTAYDDSGKGNHGALTNMDPDSDWITGKRNSALDFDGTNDYVAVDADIFDVGTGDFSISTWVKVRVADTNDRIFSVGNSYHYELWVVNSGNVYAMGGDSSSSRVFAISNSSIEDNSWHHLTAVYDRDYALKLYVDGILQDDVETGYASYSSTDYSDTSARIGSYILGTGYCIEGAIDEVKFYNYALTDGQVKVDYNSGAVRFGD